MEEGDTFAVSTNANSRLDYVQPLDFGALKRGIEIGRSEADMVNPGSAARDVSRNRRVFAGRLKKFEAAR